MDPKPAGEIVPNAAEDLPYWLALRRVPHVGPVRFALLARYFGTIGNAWQAPVPELRRVLDERTLGSLLESRESIDPGEELRTLDRLGIKAVTLADSEYPALLAQIPAAPPVLYYRGSLEALDRTCVAIVGTRRATSYGREMTQEISSGLVEAGVVIISGLAKGIDGIAHLAAIRGEGSTFAVLGSGIDIIYPSEHRGLAEKIVEQGALVSDYPPGTKPDAPNFPPRNRIISGLSVATVVIEAPLQSGALITVRRALDQNREIFVVPGNVTSRFSDGPNELVRQGARLVRNADDILEDLGLDRKAETRSQSTPVDLSENEERLLDLLTRQPQHIDELVVAANLTIADGMASMTMLELKGLARNSGSQHFVRA